jgi:intermediate peptidase
MASTTLTECTRLVNQVESAKTTEELARVPQLLDTISDSLCKVLDLAEFVRGVMPASTHEDVPNVDQHVTNANDAFHQLYDYMNELNTHQGLYRTIIRAMEEKDVSNHFSGAELNVLGTFRRDFERSGIHLKSGERTRFVRVSSEIQSLSYAFMNGHGDELRNPLRVETGQVDEWIKRFPSHFHKQNNAVYITRLDEPFVDEVMLHCRDESLRRTVYTGRFDRKDDLDVLESLLYKRHELANMLGCLDYATYFLQDKMAKTPAAVHSFLTSMSEHHYSDVYAAKQTLLKLKRQDGPADDVYPWDRSYLENKLHQHETQLPSLVAFLGHGHVMQGMSTLFQRLYNVTLEPVAPLQGETWHASVRKVHVKQANKLLGTIYLDLFKRPGKQSGGCHYTIRCARRIRPSLETVDQDVVEHEDGTYWQTPIVVLVCDFYPHHGLTLREMETLFHEMGHAMHTMLGQVEFQNVSGTRCAIDYVELPSILNESFCKDERVVSTFAKHVTTGASLPPNLLRQHVQARQRYAALETHAQLVMSHLDLKLHQLESVDHSQGYSTRVLDRLESNPRVHVLGRPPRPVPWHVGFNHLSAYGCGYYSYVFDRALANLVWQRVFAQDPWSPQAGERWMNGALKWGGVRDGWENVADVLDMPEIKEGGAHAMSMVAHTFKN